VTLSLAFIFLAGEAAEIRAVRPGFILPDIVFTGSVGSCTALRY
jgi:hypothetical protein